MKVEEELIFLADHPHVTVRPGLPLVNLHSNRRSVIPKSHQCKRVSITCSNIEIILVALDLLEV